MKTNKTVNLIAFMLGIGVGSVTTWFLIRDRYEARWKEEVAAYKATCRSEQKKENPPATEKAEPDAEDKPADPGQLFQEHAELMRKNGYINYAAPAAAEAKNDPGTSDPAGPVVISPDEFGDLEDYERISLTYYADGVLTDSDEDEINDPEPLIGDALNHFGEYDSQSVCVRNDELRCYYEVLRDLRRFETEVYPNLPPRI